MKKFNGIDLVDSLAEITRHYEIDVIERSLLKTLCDTVAADSRSADEFRIYRVLSNDETIALALMSYSKNGIIDTLDREIRDPELPDYLIEAVNDALHQKTVQVIPKSEAIDKNHIIYPSINKNDDAFAILIHSCDLIDYESQRLIHALLKVYANYLELIDKARRDKLTQLLNRETLNDEITRIIIRNNTPKNSILKFKSYPDNDNRHSLENSTYWLAIIDIDFFKKINDVYGHLYGDEILILVARLLNKSIRSHDFAFRYGGEEFIIILLANGYENATIAFERIRLAINNNSYAKVDQLTVSIGVSQIANQGDPAKIIEQADKALYYAKEHGRNQTHFYEKLLYHNMIEDESANMPDESAYFF